MNYCEDCRFHASMAEVVPAPLLEKNIRNAAVIEQRSIDLGENHCIYETEKRHGLFFLLVPS